MSSIVFFILVTLLFAFTLIFPCRSEIYMGVGFAVLLAIMSVMVCKFRNGFLTTKFFIL